MNDVPPGSRPVPPQEPHPGQTPDPTPTQALPADLPQVQGAAASDAADPAHPTDPAHPGHPVLPPDPALGPQAGHPAGHGATRQRLRDRLWSLRALIAVALASVILGGLGGAALANVGGRGDDRGGPGHGRFQRGGPGGQHFRGPGGQFGGPGQP